MPPGPRAPPDIVAAAPCALSGVLALPSSIPALDGLPLRVLQVTPRMAPHVGGVETHVREVASRLAAHHVEPVILTADETRRLPRRDEIDGVPLIRAAAWPRGRDYL